MRVHPCREKELAGDTGSEAAQGVREGNSFAPGPLISSALAKAGTSLSSQFSRCKQEIIILSSLEPIRELVR